MYRSCTTLLDASVTLSVSMALYSARYPSRKSPRGGRRMVSAKFWRLSRLLLMVIFVVEPVSSALSSSEWFRNIAVLSSLEAMA